MSLPSCQGRLQLQGVTSEHCLSCAGQPINLVKLTDFMDTCVVGWSSVNSCRAKGLNSTACALMPFFDDVDTVPYQCPFKNETQVCTLCGACRGSSQSRTET